MVLRNPLIDEALQAWTRGDLDGFEQALAPDVELLWYEPGDWDCHGREQVMALLRRSGAEGRSVFEVRIEDIDAHTLVVSALYPEQCPGPDGGAAATTVTIADGLIARLEQYRTREDALAAVASGRADGER
ncbi:MAG TPA: nuclear transport factor 2 family protein [Actinocrinis sp.]|uniref:nuclear transport factor 2 family protein n=1 Tax=Actinocrinis sp. TaxID=1920516 RepID=UPI002DDD0E23|nr:nuclear transport factor 2 family protein [Actinocrinis sp.]HEV3172640.1 nuclear transport factor 2 family protein [Actinocrinis sp.]